MNKIKKTMKK